MRLNSKFVLMLLVGIAHGQAHAITLGTVRAAAAYSTQQGGKSFLALQHGQILLEQNAREPHKVYSGTKAFWNLAALAAAEDGLLNLDERVAETIPAWRNDARKSQVTIRQLLDFSAGLDPLFFLHNDDPGDRDRLAIDAPSVANPGASFIYGPSALQVFHQVLKEKLHRESPTHYLERRVLRPLGLGAQRYLKDRADNPLLAAGWELSARQWSKLGELVLTGGAPVISSASLTQCWRGSSANRAYSLGWWNNRAAPGGREFDFEDMLTLKWPRQNWRGACLCREAPSDLVACIGSGYQRLYVIPSLDLIVVRQSESGKFSDAHFLRLLLGR
ncbi:MAG: serine hydrolase domain-containing protein [Verrucomicrobiota bacterium]